MQTSATFPAVHWIPLALLTLTVHYWTYPSTATTTSTRRTQQTCTTVSGLICLTTYARVMIHPGITHPKTPHVFVGPHLPPMTQRSLFSHDCAEEICYGEISQGSPVMPKPRTHCHPEPSHLTIQGTRREPRGLKPPFLPRNLTHVDSGIPRTKEFL